MPSTMTEPTIHVFELAGLGKAPFRFVGVQWQDIRYGQRVLGSVGGCEVSTKPGGTCAYCSRYILNMFNVESADGNHFHVGCDCIKKTGDDGLINSAKLAAKAHRRELARQREQAEFDRRRPERERKARIRQIVESERDFARSRRAAVVSVENQWLLSVLRSVGSQGDFIASMIDKLGHTRLADLSPKCVDILRDIYAKEHGRRGSKAYELAADAFDTHI